MTLSIWLFCALSQVTTATTTTVAAPNATLAPVAELERVAPAGAATATPTAAKPEARRTGSPIAPNRHLLSFGLEMGRSARAKPTVEMSGELVWSERKRDYSISLALRVSGLDSEFAIGAGARVGRLFHFASDWLTLTPYAEVGLRYDGHTVFDPRVDPFCRGSCSSEDGVFVSSLSAYAGGRLQQALNLGRHFSPHIAVFGQFIIPFYLGGSQVGNRTAAAGEFAANFDIEYRLAWTLGLEFGFSFGLEYARASSSRSYGGNYASPSPPPSSPDKRR